MIQLIADGQYELFIMLLLAIICSLSLHEYGHAKTAKVLGDDTAARLGRLTINPIAHIDPVGLIMVVVVGFGYAKPVPVNPRLMRTAWAGALVAAAGPFMNLVLAALAINSYVLLAAILGVEPGDGWAVGLGILAQINLLLMLFNLIPLGPLDGHYIFSWLLPERFRETYERLNMTYGTYLFLALILLSILDVPIFSFLMTFSGELIPYLIFVHWLF